MRKHVAWWTTCQLAWRATQQVVNDSPNIQMALHQEEDQQPGSNLPSQQPANNLSTTCQLAWRATQQVINDSPHTQMALHEEEDQPGRQCQVSPKHLSVQRSHVVTRWPHWTCLASWIGSRRAAQSLELPVDSGPGSLCPVHEQLCCPNRAQNQAVASRLKFLSTVPASTGKQLQVVWSSWIWRLQAQGSNCKLSGTLKHGVCRDRTAMLLCGVSC